MNENTDNKKRVTIVGIIALCLAFCILLALVVIACQLSFMNTTRLVELASDDGCCCPCHYDCDDCCCGCCENSAAADEILVSEGYWDEQALANLTQSIAEEEEDPAPAAYVEDGNGRIISTPATPNRGTLPDDDDDDDTGSNPPSTPGSGGSSDPAPDTGSDDDGDDDGGNGGGNNENTDPNPPSEGTDGNNPAPSDPPADDNGTPTTPDTGDGDNAGDSGNDDTTGDQPTGTQREDATHFVIGSEDIVAEQPPVPLIF